MKKLFKILQKRWKSESPKLFKQLLKISITLGSASLGVIAMDKFINLQSLGVSPIVFTICGYILTFCGAMGLTSKLTIKDTNDTN